MEKLFFKTFFFKQKKNRGIRGLSKDVDLRIDSLIRELNREDCDYDLIALQEVCFKKI